MLKICRYKYIKFDEKKEEEKIVEVERSPVGAVGGWQGPLDRDQECTAKENSAENIDL